MTDSAAGESRRAEEGARLFASLREPFQAVDLGWRVMWKRAPDREGQGPLVLVTPYVNRPALINRLNQVCGLQGWQTDARVSGQHVYVGVGVLVAGEWVWRWDGTGFLDHDPDGKGLSIAEAGKGNFSNAFKRACEQLGCALYLRELKPLKAIINNNGRFKVRVGSTDYRWDPPGLDGTPSYPGEIPGFDAAEGGDPTGNGQTPPDNPPVATPPKQLDEEQKKARISQLREQLRAWMEKERYKVYHLEAVLQTHPQLKLRVETADKLGRLGSLEDWELLIATTERRAGRWSDAPRELSKEYPASPDDLVRLDELMDQLKLESSERIHIEEAKSVGWNDAILFWIEKLGSRT